MPFERDTMQALEKADERTAMTDTAPERIWAQCTACNNWNEPIASQLRVDHFHEYIRADLATRQRDEAVGAMAERLPRPKDASIWTLDPDFVMKVTHDIDREGWEATMEVVELAMLEAERALTPPDATAALERVKREAYEHCLNMLNNHHPIDALALIKVCAKGDKANG